MEKDAATWAHRQFNRSGLGDKRLRKRLVTIATAMAEAPGRSITGLFKHRRDSKAAYQLFNHEDATPENVQRSHRDQVRWQLAEAGTYLLLEDTTEVTWANATERPGLGITSAKRQQGFLLHSVLAVAWDQEAQLADLAHRGPLKVLGLADQQFHIRQPIPSGERNSDSLKRQARWLESRLWTEAGANIGEAPPQSRWIMVCDRGADIYEFLQDCRSRQHHYVVRAAQDRVLQALVDGAERKLFPAIRRQPSLGAFTLEFRRRGTVPARQATMQVSAIPVQLRSPARPGHGPGALPPITCTIVRVWEDAPPANVEALEWLLLVSDPVTSFADALTCARQYACRWLIEEYHKALKTGLGAERLQLTTAPRLFATIAVMAIVALRLVEFKEAVRLSPQAPASTSGLSPLERHLLGAYLERDLHTVRDVALAVGRLGGHMNRKGDGMPGMITLWRGWVRLQDMVQGACLALQTRT
jgi:hypothetical protein